MTPPATTATATQSVEVPSPSATGKKVDPEPDSAEVPYYRNCDQAYDAGVAPLFEGEPGYRAALDADGDGEACEGRQGNGDPGPGSDGDVYYENCAAVRAAGADPIRKGEPGYGRHLDRDGDGVGCE
ncbi:excalibur calcium-binding domain-containing protein [Plantactinospora endophytica]|uniref:Excalibur calcium-binding domain-containing protein n=1 Tax=Plantactinospora endophytica TaxID=673535 RepID=A0ABQ4EEN1_9ACTN|nr:excalibur calcium-binding domain-containing protein [Plantactinospora endophytica]GIG93186.1 hypothetical protein Pen02_81220 [Plantactinospora endophytica]